MDCVLSPYEIAARTIGSGTALLLCRGVVTLRPHPPEQGDSGAGLGNRVPVETLVDRWRWTVPLWQQGVMGGHWQREDPWDELGRARAMVEADPRAAHLRPVFDRFPTASDPRGFERVCRDLVTGGGDPSLVVPLTVASELFAARTGLAFIRSEARSIVGRLERRTLRPALRLLLPIVMSPSPEWLLSSRVILEDRLAPIRDALANAADGLRDADSESDVRELWEAEGRRAWDDLCERIREHIEAGHETDRDNGRRVTAAISVSAVPADASIRVAAGAQAHASGTGRASKPVAPRPALADRRLVVLSIRPSGWTA